MPVKAAIPVVIAAIGANAVASAAPAPTIPGVAAFAPAPTPSQPSAAFFKLFD